MERAEVTSTPPSGHPAEGTLSLASSAVEQLPPDHLLKYVDHTIKRRAGRYLWYAHVTSILRYLHLSIGISSAIAAAVFAQFPERTREAVFGAVLTALTHATSKLIPDRFDAIRYLHHAEDLANLASRVFAKIGNIPLEQHQLIETRQAYAELTKETIHAYEEMIREWRHRSTGKNRTHADRTAQGDR